MDKVVEKVTNKLQRVEDLVGSVDVATSDELDSDTLNPEAVATMARSMATLYENASASEMIAMLESIVRSLEVDVRAEEDEANG